jgi:tripartite-type tricarboxylate transporter receptor subunit TctC
MMLTLRFAASICMAGLMVLDAGIACSQNYPGKPIRVITAETGGASDFQSRVIAPGILDAMGQPVIVDNRGGSAVIPIEMVAKASPDGYTLLVFGSALWYLPYMQDVSYDPLKDLVPITLFAISPAVVVVHPTLPVKSIKELIALAKAKPGALNYASGIAGSLTHLPGELFKAMAGVNIVRVAYKGGGPALNAILSGEVQVMFAAGATGAPHINAGRLRGLAVTTAQPTRLFPNLPTVAAEGLPGYENVGTQGLFAPARTPAAVIQKLNAEVVKILNRPEVKERFVNTGSEVVANTPEQYVAYIKSDMTRMGKVIKDAGIRAE